MLVSSIIAFIGVLFILLFIILGFVAFMYAFTSDCYHVESYGDTAIQMLMIGLVIFVIAGAVKIIEWLILILLR